MWNNEKKEKEKMVKCDTCKHYVDETGIQKITTTWLGYYYLSREIIYLCSLCRKPYDFIWVLECNRERNYFKTIPEHKKQVNEDGTPYVEPTAKTETPVVVKRMYRKKCSHCLRKFKGYRGLNSHLKKNKK